ncbi:hypothetical protein DNTS_023484 [Danionella cerebrum]|uniref:Glycosyl hydrolase family 13 catalytic domain-containing protein n=1 Tax=Danionella cerebrum TaxID=2873325 RepID=A0A553MWG8_9TELE|nr:hypothetical protein DNTS_023484 [Danionella translucida]
MSNETEVDMKDVELNEVEQEKQPMKQSEAGNNYEISPVSEKNGIVKIKIPEEESKFTGLSKEELMKVAGTPGWIKVRWALLILFWLGWLGMLAGAIAIIIQAPRCKPLPEMNWWNQGPLYQIGDISVFANSSDPKGVVDKVRTLDELKVKGLIVGPIHVTTADNQDELNLVGVSKEAGSLTQFTDLIAAAHKRSIKVILDLTPNYKGNEPWFSNNGVTLNLKPAILYWMKYVDGFLFYNVEKISSEAPSLWKEVEVLIHNQTEKAEKMVLIGVTNQTSPDDIAATLNKTGVDLLLSGALMFKSGLEVADSVNSLYSTYNQTKLAWNIGGRIAGHLASIVGLAKVKLNQLMLLTLPGTPVFNYGDEIGLSDEQSNNPSMVWNFKEENKEMSTFRAFFKSVSERRTKERSLQFGEYLPLFNSTFAMAYLRQWDQNERFIVALNWHSNETVTLQLKHAEVPEYATVVFSSSDQNDVGKQVNLQNLEIAPEQGIMVKFPYIA